MKNSRTDKIVQFFLKNQSAGSSAVLAFLTSENMAASLITVKRDISKLTAAGILEKHGKGPETSYSLATLGRVMAGVNTHEYCSIEQDKRYGQSSYNFSFFEQLRVKLFSEVEVKKLSEATAGFQSKVVGMSPTLARKELERFVIELSWKSSRIEGNTYTLLDTEKLIKDGILAGGHSKDEATMILNHKRAFDFVYANKTIFKKIDRVNTEEVHHLIAHDLNVTRGYRRGMVGVTGSKYRPLDNEHQIKEAMEHLFSAVNRMEDPYSKALLALLGISYIQPFEDGNKRTSRIMANAILMAHGLSPLSYRSVDEELYREAMMVFYELNSVTPFKEIFINQYVFATLNYFVT